MKLVDILVVLLVCAAILVGYFMGVREGFKRCPVPTFDNVIWHEDTRQRG